jgi:hypothetical protein
MAPTEARPILGGRHLRRASLAVLLIFVIFVAQTALRQAFATDDFPEDLAVKVELLPVLFPLHMLAGGLALIVVPAALFARLRPRWHRTAGRIAAVVVLVAGVTAVPVALVAPVTPVSAAGFTAQALTWLTLLAFGIGYARSGRYAAHRACMLLMTAVTSGAIFFRIYLATWAIFAHGRHFAAFYAVDAWLAWLLPVGATAAVLNTFRTRERPSQER